MPTTLPHDGPLADRIRARMRRRADCQDLIARALAEIDDLTEQIDRDLEELAERTQRGAT